MDELEEPRRLKDYLLGTLDDEAVQRRIEERLMVDEEFAVRISAAEDELIEQFLDGELSDAEADRFETFFLAPPERRSQFRLTRDLRRVAVAKANVPSSHPISSQSARGLWTGWLQFSAAAAAMLLAALGIWRFAIYESETDKGLDALRAAYRDQRPVEPRLTALPSYAPYSETRGGGSPVTDSAALDKANRYLLDATTDAGSAAAHQGLAMYYLASGDLDRAEREIGLALKDAPDDARIQSDAGALYLERARQTDPEGDARKVVLLNESLKHLDRAISLEPKLLEARFNRALCVQALMNAEEAKSAWYEYLELDTHSKWADEAKQYLQKLERETPRERSAGELEADFLAAFRANNDDEAERLVGTNRELIRDKYLPMRLAMSFLKAPEKRRDELLEALAYNGAIEMKLTGDPFAKEIAHFYRVAPAAKRQRLEASHDLIRKGLSLCLDQRYSDALPSFQQAQKDFEESGDIYTAHIARYFAAYALKNVDRRTEASAEFESVSSWAREHKFAWLEATALHWVASCLLDAKQLTESRRAFEQALAIARKMNDSYATQRNLGLLAHLHSISGQQDAALKYLWAALKESEKPETSLRQRFRNLFFVCPILLRAGLINAMRPAAMEVMKSADQQKDQMWMVQSRGFAAIASAQNGDIATARALLDESRVKAAAIVDEGQRSMLTAFSNLMSADLERYLGNLDSAEKQYLEAARFYDAGSNFALLREQVHEGLLMTYLTGGNLQKLDEQIPLNVRLAEEYRPHILDDDLRIGFFDLRGNVYDIACELEFDRGNIEAAYNYAEASSSRSLLDRMQSGVTEAPDALRQTVLPKDRSQPLDIGGIRTSIPAGVRLVQFSVFESKTIVWLISKEDFHAVPIKIDIKDLQGRVADYTNRISRLSSADDPETKRSGGELYRLLIDPIRQYLKPDEELCFIPSKMLFDLAFGSLPSPEGKALIETSTLLYAPSANVFILASRTAEERNHGPHESILAVGNPSFPSERLDDLPPLPDAENETQDISKLYPRRQIMIRAAATKDAFLRAIGGTDVVHFSGHYVAVPGSPMSSYLLLAAAGDDPARSELSNLELSRISLKRTKLIILAACRSGVETYSRSEGMAGMARTVLAAQVPLVVASQWNVDSEATATLMTRFHQHRRNEQMSTTAALRSAQLELLNDPTGRFRSPYYWAGFAAYGGHAEF